VAHTNGHKWQTSMVPRVPREALEPREARVQREARGPLGQRVALGPLEPLELLVVSQPVVMALCLHGTLAHQHGQHALHPSFMARAPNQTVGVLQ
jgi:hypothetical protein